jgi:hypothetical protein
MKVEILTGPAKRSEQVPSLDDRINDFIYYGTVNDNGYHYPVRIIDIKFCSVPGEPAELYALIMYEADNRG